MSKPRISVIITVYNQERYLAEAIQSVLNQDYDDLEVIVVDDGSTDRSAEIAKQYESVRVIQQENAGYGAAVNTGISNARGELVAFLDADDVWEPGMLAGRAARFDGDPELQITHGMLVEFVSPELKDRGVTAGRVEGKPVRGPLGGTTMIRRAALERVGPMNTEVRLGALMDWLMRAREVGVKTQFHQELLLHRRIHDDNLGKRERASQGDYLKLLKSALDRRRRTEETASDAQSDQ